MKRPAFKYYVTYNSVITEVFPFNTSKCKLVSEQVKDQIFYRKKFAGKLHFENNSKLGIFDFDYFYAIESAGNSCVKIEFEIYQFCEGSGYGSYIPAWQGKFTTGSGSFDINKCIFEVTPDVVDKYTCFLENINEELDILQSGLLALNTASTAIGTVQTLVHELIERQCPLNLPYYFDSESCLLNGNPISCPANFNEWCLITVQKQIVKGFDCAGQENIRTTTTTYKREIYTTACVVSCAASPPPLGTWNLLTDNCGGGTCTWWRCNSADYTLSRLIRVDEIIELLLAQTGCNLTYKSILFNRNPDTSDSFYVNYTSGGTLDYMTGLPTMIANLMLSQKSDVKYPNASNPASHAIVILEKLLDNFREIFQAYWDIDDSGNFKIEHISYFISQVSSVDLTSSSPYIEFIKSKEFYEHQKVDIPRKETFTFMENDRKYDEGDFTGKPIIYSDDCSNEDNTETHDVSDITTNLKFIADYPNDISDEGFVLVSCYKSGVLYYINVETGMLSGVTLINGHLSWANLHYNYHRHYRYLSSGNMNGVNTSFFSWKPNVKQVVLEFPICCTEIIPNNVFQTVLSNQYLGGSGYVTTMEQDLHSGMIKLTLKYSI